jgi:hypothetical protein
VHDERVIIVRQTRDLLAAVADIGGLGVILYFVMSVLLAPFA